MNSQQNPYDPWPPPYNNKAWEDCIPLDEVAPPPYTTHGAAVDSIFASERRVSRRVSSAPREPIQSSAAVGDLSILDPLLLVSLQSAEERD